MINLFYLLCAHALCDYPLQGNYMAMAKNRHTESARGIWPWVLTSHALIHGGAVALITGSVWLGIAETVAHWLIDFGKCEKWYDFNTDQWLHVACKLVWYALM